MSAAIARPFEGMPLEAEKRRAYVERLADFLGEHLMVEPEAILGTTRRHRAAHARILIMYCLYERGWRLVEIGQVVQRDHSTVFAAIRRMAALFAAYPELAAVYKLMPAPDTQQFSEPDLLALYTQLQHHLVEADALRARIDYHLSQQNIPLRARQVAWSVSA